MLTIRPQQEEAFRQAALRRFEDDMVAHLNKFAPKHCEVIGEPAVRSVIRLGMERAKQYGFTNRGPVRFYLELMFMFGSHFDRDPQLVWASDILNDSGETDQQRRAERLHESTMEYLNGVVGAKREYYLAALRRLNTASLEDFPICGVDAEEVGLRGLKMIYPQKCEFVGEKCLRLLIQHGITLARSYSVATVPGVALFVSLAFALGYGFADDPQFPWVSAVLKDGTVPNPQDLTERLSKRARAYLAGVLAQSQTEE